MSVSQTVKVNGRMTNAIFFLAANIFPVCSDPDWESHVTSEVREIIAVCIEEQRESEFVLLFMICCSQNNFCLQSEHKSTKRRDDVK